ncbi:hypothetical protein B0H21DRAFT_146708 [Amylocystis lapponica]|nr:hypothetical protein B0H21DRAFT_146708 [Amylocystis lapponica]
MIQPRKVNKRHSNSRIADKYRACRVRHTHETVFGSRRRLELGEYCGRYWNCTRPMSIRRGCEGPSECMQRRCIPAAHAHTFMGQRGPVNDRAKPNAPQPRRHAHLARRARTHHARAQPPKPHINARHVRRARLRAHRVRRRPRPRRPPHLPPAPCRIPLRHGRPQCRAPSLPCHRAVRAAAPAAVPSRPRQLRMGACARHTTAHPPAGPARPARAHRTPPRGHGCAHTRHPRRTRHAPHHHRDVRPAHERVHPVLCALLHLRTHVKRRPQPVIIRG